MSTRGTTPSPPSGWRADVEALLGAYSQVDREALRLPVLGSVEPSLSYTSVAGIAGEFRGLREMIRRRREAPPAARPLTQAMEAVELAASGGSDTAATFLAVVRGEAFLASSGNVSRALVASFLAGHFRRRLTLLRRWILLGRRGGDGVDELISRVDDALEIWRPRTTVSGSVTYSVTLLGTVGGLAGVAKGAPHVPWYGWVLAALLIFLAYQFIVGSYVAKRGLMLGGSTKTGYVPGRISGTGVYALERRVFEPLDISRTESPMDLLLASLLLAVLVVLAFAVTWWLGLLMALALVPNAVAYVRRRQLGRL